MKEPRDVILDAPMEHIESIAGLLLDKARDWREWAKIRRAQGLPESAKSFEQAEELAVACACLLVGRELADVEHGNES